PASEKPPTGAAHSTCPILRLPTVAQPGHAVVSSLAMGHLLSPIVCCAVVCENVPSAGFEPAPPLCESGALPNKLTGRRPWAVGGARGCCFRRTCGRS